MCSYFQCHCTAFTLCVSFLTPYLYYGGERCVDSTVLIDYLCGHLRQISWAMYITINLLDYYSTKQSYSSRAVSCVPTFCVVALHFHHSSPLSLHFSTVEGNAAQTVLFPLISFVVTCVRYLGCNGRNSHCNLSVGAFRRTDR